MSGVVPQLAHAQAGADAAAASERALADARRQHDDDVRALRAELASSTSALTAAHDKIAAQAAALTSQASKVDTEEAVAVLENKLLKNELAALRQTLKDCEWKLRYLCSWSVCVWYV